MNGPPHDEHDHDHDHAHDHDGWFTRLLDRWSEHEQARFDAQAGRFPSDATGVLVVFHAAPGWEDLPGRRWYVNAFLVAIDGTEWRPAFPGANLVPATPGVHRVEMCLGPRLGSPEGWHHDVPVMVPAHGLVRVEYRMESRWGDAQVTVLDA